jgi:hypothetical protein
MRRFSSALCLLSGLAVTACSSTPAPTPTDASVGTDVQDIAVVDESLSGFGSVLVTWTVNGMPPETGCAAAGAQNVRLQVFFGRPEMVPCTQGRFEAQNVSASTLNIGADLLRADGTAIYQYNLETTVRGGQTANVNVPFEPPGSLRVTWTVNGLPAAQECNNVGGYDVRLQGRRLTAPTRPPTCRAGVYTFQNIQPGDWSVEGTLTVLATSTTVRGINTQMGSAMVPSGGAGEVELAFEAPQRDQ